MRGNTSRRELEREYGRHVTIQSLTVWNTLTKAVKKNKTIADIFVGAKAPSEAWNMLKHMVDDDNNSERAKEQVQLNFEELSIGNAESMKEYIARAKSIALNVKYHGIEVPEQEISLRGLNGVASVYAPEKRNFAKNRFQSE